MLAFAQLGRASLPTRTRSLRVASARAYTPINMGIVKEILKEGSGPNPTKGQKVRVHCTGYGKNNDLSMQFWR
jgi:FKBP-type peptidyl-prolyl cis-trans isomerase